MDSTDALSRSRYRERRLNNNNNNNSGMITSVRSSRVFYRVLLR